LGDVNISEDAGNSIIQVWKVLWHLRLS